MKRRPYQLNDHCQLQVGSTLLRDLLCVGIISGLLATATLRADSSVQDDVRSKVNAEYPLLFELYKHLHANPELSFH